MYKYKKGDRQSLTKVDATEFEEEEDAAEAFAEYLAEEAASAKQPERASSRSRSRSPRGCGLMESESAPSPPRHSGSATDLLSAAFAQRPAVQRCPPSEESRATLLAQPLRPAEPQAATRSRSPRHSARQRSESPRPPHAKKVDSGKGGSFRVSAISLRTKDPKKLLGLCSELLRDHEKVTPEQLLAGKWQRRTVQHLEQRMQTASASCACIVDPQHKKEAEVMAEQLLRASEDLDVMFTLLEDVRCRPHQFIAAQENAPRREAVMSLPLSIGVQSYTAITSAGVLRCVPAHEDAVRDMIEFLPFQGGAAFGLELLLLLEAKHSPNFGELTGEVQTLAIVNLLDHLWKTHTENEYCKSMEHLLAVGGCPVSVKKNAFSDDGWNPSRSMAGQTRPSLTSVSPWSCMRSSRGSCAATPRRT